MTWYEQAVIGHEETAKLFDIAFRSDRIPSAYLLVGRRGIGKTTLIHRFAQMMNCIDHSICHVCENCRLYDRHQHPDFHLVKPAGQNIRLHQIHSLIEAMVLMPSVAAKRLVVMKDAHKLNTESANSFLKLLEEPPLNTLIVLLTTDEQLLPETVRSRCQILGVPPLSASDLQELICSQYQLGEEALAFVLCYAQGRIRKRFIDNAQKLLTVRRQVFHLLMNLSDEKMLDHCFRLEQWIKQELHLYVIEFCMAWIRDWIHILLGNPEHLINQDVADEFKASSPPFSLEQLRWAFDLVVETETTIAGNASRPLALESLILQLKRIQEGVTVI